MRRAIRLPPLKIEPGKLKENFIFHHYSINSVYEERNNLDWPKNPRVLLPIAPVTNGTINALPGK